MPSPQPDLVSTASARSIAASVNAGRSRAADHAEAALDRLARIAPLNAMTHVDAALARQTAARVDAARAEGRTLPLAGVPFVIKDNLYTPDQPTTGASPALEGFAAPRHATTVRQLLDAGAVPLGKANMHELAFGITSANAHYGAVGNPHDPARVAGGSSGGTAAAVAAGIPFGLGTDTGGSVRIPAAFCGVYGLRPTLHRYSTDGVLSLSHTRDTVGPIGQDLDDLLLLDSVLAGDASEPAAPPLAGLTIGVPGTPYADGFDPFVAAAVEDAHARLAKAGARLVPIDARALHDADEACGFAIVAFETHAYWRRFSADRLGLPFAEFVARLASHDVRNLFQGLLEAPPSSRAYAAALDTRTTMIHWYDQAFRHSGVDCLLMPTVSCIAPLMSASRHDLAPEQAGALFSRVLRQTSPATLAGVPSVSLPAGRVAQAPAPVGLMLEGPAGSDRRLLAIARALDRLLRDAG